MSTDYMISDLSLEEKDPIQHIGKNALLQFITFDFLTLKTYEVLVEKLHAYRQNRGVGYNQVYNSPYHLDYDQLKDLEAIFEEDWEASNQVKSVDSDMSRESDKKRKAVDRDAIKDDTIAINKRKTTIPPLTCDTTVRLSDRIRCIENWVGLYRKPNEINKILSALSSSYLDLNDPEPYNVAPNPIDLFKIYVISLTLQRLWSYVLVNTRRIYEFKVEQNIAELQRSSNLYATYDKPNSEASEYFVESLEAKFLGELREANSGMAIGEEVEDILVEVALHCGFLLENSLERVELEAEGFVKEELNEKNILNILFPEIDGPVEHTLSSLLEASGVISIFDKAEAYLPNDIFDLLNSGILNSLVSAWGPLFTEMQPEVLDILVSLIPTIIDRFRTSSTNSEEQQEIRKGALELMKVFLEGAILPVRVTDLRDVLDRPSANSSLYYFRSLLAMVDKDKGIKPWETDYHTPWDSRHLTSPPFDSAYEPDQFVAGRLNYLRIAHWVLTDEKELGELFIYARALYDDEVERKEFFEEIAEEKFKELVPSAMFPGTLETSDVLPMGGMLIDMNYQRQKKNKEILLSRLGRVGGIETALKDAKVRWMP